MVMLSSVRRDVAVLGLVVFCMAGVAPAAAQTGVVTGVVVDSTSGVLPGATVTLIGGPDAPRAAQTDARGRFAFAGLPPGIYTVTVFLSGFDQVTVSDVVVTADPVALPVITLRLTAFDDVVVVTATRLEAPLQQVPMSISAVTGADLERRAIDNLTELSRWTPGLTVVDQGARGSNVIIARGLHTDALNGSEFAGNNYNNGVGTYLGDIPAGGRSPAARHRAGGGAARTPGNAVRRRHAGGGCALPPRAGRTRSGARSTSAATCSHWRTAAPPEPTPA